MKPRYSPHFTVLVLTLGQLLLLASLFLLSHFLHSLVLLGIAGVLCFALNWLILEIFIYRRLRTLYHKVLNVIKRRKKLDTLKPHADSIEGLYQALLELSSSVVKEIKQMRQVDLLRKEYIGDVSHELKTPLFAIQGYLETLLDGAMEDKAVNRKFLKQALRNVNRLNNLVQDLLTISQLESGQLQMNKEPFRIYNLLLDVLELLNFEITFRQIKVHIKANKLENQEVLADKDRIQQVLYNLLVNAIRYGKEEGNITLELTETKNKINVAVIDDGPGIAPEHLPHIFDRFYRIEKSRSRKNGGTGLGLSIVKNLIEAHEESIFVESEVGKGCRFQFTLEKAV
ncbi:MAG: ATP-binding protein [Bacteroidia bacterium]|nr:cell wall metabolism sensor histidine kinase WalK [Bacteroidia bacterium]MDW8158582.1 ATP-binding protein [Bacteroidia bacterium]